MIYKLNPALTETPLYRDEYDKRTPIQKLYDKIQFKLDRDNGNTVIDIRKSAFTQVRGFLTPHLNVECSYQSGLLHMISDAYSRHVKIAIAPHDIWYLLLTEILEIVTNNSEACRKLFTSSNEKITIMIPTNDVTAIDPSELLVLLRELVPVDVNLFLPEFSTATDGYNLAAAASFAGALQPYYDYMTFCCGIPEIKILGTIEDWDLIATNFLKICTTLDISCDIKEYKGRRIVDWFNEVYTIIGNIADGFCEGTEEASTNFMRGIFSRENIGSGSQFIVQGWISKLYSNVPDLAKIDNFNTSWGILPYTNLETGREFRGVHGAFISKRDEEGFVGVDYDEVIFMKLTPEEIASNQSRT